MTNTKRQKDKKTKRQKDKDKKDKSCRKVWAGLISDKLDFASIHWILLRQSQILGKRNLEEVDWTWPIDDWHDHHRHHHHDHHDDGWLNSANWWLAWSSSSSSAWWWMIGLGQLMIGMIIIVMIIIIIMMMDDWTRPIDDQQTNSFWNKETFPGVKHVSHRSIMILSPSAPLLSRLQILCRTKKEPWIILGTILSESYKLYQDS